MPEVRFELDDKTWLEWRGVAKCLGIPLSAWIKLRVAGLLQRGELVETPTAPVQETTQERNPDVRPPGVRPPGGWLRERIAAEIGNDPLPHSQVLTLARKLGVEPKKVFSSLGSMVGSGRLRHEGEVYYPIEKE